MTRSIQTPDTSEGPKLNIPIDKIAFIIVKAREYDAKEADSDPDSGSNPTDDNDRDVLEDKQGDQTRHELVAAINDLNEDEQNELVALAWLGRGTYDITEWEDAVETASDAHNKRTAQYLLSLPLLGDYLEDGLEAFGDSIVDMDDTRDPAS
ncbi:MAG TPA: DUF3775 domain-containing protein [Rhizomicrobium sp.]|nr:DUF3775 domain-containing protein [Rhizomicrobium sp.]